jgi:hypothetical protein
MQKSDWKAERNGLIAKRDLLFKQFEANPMNIVLGQDIKKLDDQVAECDEHPRTDFADLR